MNTFGFVCTTYYFYSQLTSKRFNYLTCWSVKRFNSSAIHDRQTERKQNSWRLDSVTRYLGGPIKARSGYRSGTNCNAWPRLKCNDVLDSSSYVRTYVMYWWHSRLVFNCAIVSHNFHQSIVCSTMALAIKKNSYFLWTCLSLSPSFADYHYDQWYCDSCGILSDLKINRFLN